MDLRLRGLLNLPSAAERHLHELPQIQVTVIGLVVCVCNAAYQTVSALTMMAEAGVSPAADVDEAAAWSAGLSQLHLRVL
jgi:hypothetical protein